LKNWGFNSPLSSPEKAALKVQVKFLATIRLITEELSTELLCNPRDTTMTLIQKLVKKYGQKFKQVTMVGTNLKPGVKIIINGRDIDYLNGLFTQLKDGDVIVIIPPIAGG
jgi:molybdopterin synthase sulfur carrier subunit